MINFVFLGAPGAGKGSVAKKVAAEKGIIHISTGKIFREHIDKQTKIGLNVKEILSFGKYVPDDLTNEIVKNRLNKPDVKHHGFILDGYPRTLNQAKFLETITSKDNLKVVLLKTSENVILKRLAKRAKEENRKDDSQGVIYNRIMIYNKKTAPLIEYYKAQKQLQTINTDGTISENVQVFYKECFIDYN